jgi:hypothetical protein
LEEAFTFSREGRMEIDREINALQRTAAMLLILVTETASVLSPLQAQAGRVAKTQTKATKESHDLGAFLEAPSQYCSFQEEEGAL